MKYKLIITYGIAAYNKGELIASVPGISTSRRRMKKFCRLCNKLKLDPNQLNDVAEDFLCV